MPRRRAQDEEEDVGLRRCGECGGVLSGIGAERDFVAVCRCQGKRGVKARAAHVGHRTTVRTSFGDEFEDMLLS